MRSTGSDMRGTSSCGCANATRSGRAAVTARVSTLGPEPVGAATGRDDGWQRMMQRFWSWLAVELGRRAGLAAVIGLLITPVLGYGVTRLEFATGQASDLTKSDQIYKDNVKYQNLFGGQAMLGLVTMDEGHTVNELFDAPGIAQWQSLHDDLSAARMTDAADSPPAYLAVATPLIGLQYTDILAQNGVPGTDPTQAFAGQLTLRALAQEEPGSDAYNARQADS